MNKTSSILIIGLGSMGKRRIRNLMKLGYKNIIGFDVREDRRIEANKVYGIETISNMNSILERKPKIVIISTPPDLHLKYANIAIKKEINFFMELNLISKDVKTIIQKSKKKSIIISPSSTMLFHPVVKKLKKLLDAQMIGRVLTVFHHTGHYLPNWHPWEDYRDFFVSKKETGGAKEILPIELSWLIYLFSSVQSVCGNVKKISKLDTDIDDVYQLLLEFENNIMCTLVIDVLSIPSSRETRIIGEKGTIICDFINGFIKISQGHDWKSIKVNMGIVAKGYKKGTPPETPYEDEMRSFLDHVNLNKKYPLSIADELKILQIVDAASVSSRNGTKIYF